MFETLMPFVTPAGVLIFFVYVSFRLRRCDEEAERLVWQVQLLRREVSKQQSAPTDGEIGDPTEKDVTPDNKLEVSMSEETSSEEKSSRRIRFLVDSLVLFRFFQHVCPNEGRVRVVRSCLSSERFKEVFSYCTGQRIDDDTYTINHLVPVSFSEQTSGGVKVAESSNISALSILDELGLPLVAHCHSHPTWGAQSTNSSMTDNRFQERLERGGHIAIGMIFSRDGYVRFFSGKELDFEVRVLGNRIKKVEDYVYQLSLEDSQFFLASDIGR